MTSRNAGRYTIMAQPQPSCVNLRHVGRTNHHKYHYMTLRPYHSHHTLQKRVRHTTCSTKIVQGCRYSEKTSQNYIDHVSVSEMAGS
jgi:hypothetical protein